MCLGISNRTYTNGLPAQPSTHRQTVHNAHYRPYGRIVIVRMRIIIETITVSLGLLTLAGIVGVELLYLSGLYEMVLLLLQLLCA